MNLYPTEHICPECGKTFLARDPWGYTRSGAKYCTWTCFRKNERHARSEGSRKRLGDRERKEIVALLSEGMSPPKISAMLGVTLQAVLYYRKKIGGETA